MLPESIESLYRLLRDREIKVLLAGGWAVNEHGYSRQTVDVDWVASEKEKDPIQSLMRLLKFTPESESNLVTRFVPKTLELPTVDFLWVDPSTFSKLDTNDSFAGRHKAIPMLLSLIHI